MPDSPVVVAKLVIELTDDGAYTYRVEVGSFGEAKELARQFLNGTPGPNAA